MYKNERNIFIHIYDTSNRNPAKSAISFVASLFLLRPKQSIELLIGFYLSLLTQSYYFKEVIIYKASSSLSSSFSSLSSAK